MEQIFTQPYLIPFLSIFIPLIIFFCIALMEKGIQKFSVFTIAVLIIFIAISIAGIINANLLMFLPDRIIYAPHNDKIWVLPLFCFLAFFIVSLIYIWKEKTTPFLLLFWLLLVLLNLSDLAHRSYQYFTWVAPVLKKNATPFDIIEMRMILQVKNKERYLQLMIYPLCWLIISAISLIKIYMEKRRSLAVQTAS